MQKYQRSETVDAKAEVIEELQKGIQEHIQNIKLLGGGNVSIKAVDKDFVADDLDEKEKKEPNTQGDVSEDNID